MGFLEVLDRIAEEHKSAGDLTLDECFEILGETWYMWAIKCPLDELKRSINHPDDFLGVGIAYERIYLERTKH